MRTVKSLSSLSTLAVGTTVVLPMTATAFSPPPLPPTQSQPCLLTMLSAATPLSSGDIDLPPLPPPTASVETTMTVSTTASPSAFLTSQPPLMTDPSVLLGKQHQPSFVVDLPVLVDPDTPHITDPQLVPPTKSLRNKLNLPQSTQLASTTTTSRRPRIVGHRGALYQELENTRPGFLACTGICDAVELDVFELPADGTLVVFHGSGTDKNPGLLEDYCINPPSKSILDLTYEQTQQLQFNPEYTELAAPSESIVRGQIPTLEQVLMDLKPTGMEVKIELKGPGTARPVVELVDRLNMVDQVSFSSFNHKEIAMVRKMRPQTQPDGRFVYRTGALFDDVPANFVQRAQRVGASEVHLRYDTCTVDHIQAIHKAGMGSMAWFRGPVGMKADTANKFWDIGNEDATCFDTVVQTGVEQLCVNKPQVLFDYLKQQSETQQQQEQMEAMIVRSLLPPPATSVAVFPATMVAAQS